MRFEQGKLPSVSNDVISSSSPQLSIISGILTRPEMHMPFLNFRSICRDAVALLSVLIATASATAQEVWTFEEHVSPFLSKYCTSCHGEEEMESGIRVDLLDGELRGRRQFLWKAIDKLVAEKKMPPEDEPQPTADERKALVLWIDGAIEKSLLRDKERNGSARRLTVAQYRYTL